MGSLFGFAAESVKRSVGASVVSAIFLAAGVNVQNIAAAFFDTPPAWMTWWWPPWVFVVFSVLLFAHIFQKQVVWLNSSGPRPDASILWLFDHLNNYSKWSIGRAYESGQIVYQVEREIRDAAKAERILIWGRQALSDYVWTAPISSTETEIESEYWMYADIDITTVCTQGDTPVKTSINQDGTARVMQDLGVNKAQCLKEWPRASHIRRFFDRKYKDRKLSFPKMNDGAR